MRIPRRPLLPKRTRTPLTKNRLKREERVEKERREARKRRLLSSDPIFSIKMKTPKLKRRG